MVPYRGLLGIASRLIAPLVVCFAVAGCLTAGAAWAQTQQQIADRYERLIAAKKYREAAPVLKQLIELQEKSGGRDDLKTMVYLNGLAALYVSLGQHADAEITLRQALERGERVAGKESGILIETLTALGAVLDSLNRVGEAVPLLARAVRLSELRLAPDHPTFLTCLSNLAIAYAKTGQYAQAEPLLLRVLAAQEKKDGVDHAGSEAVIIYLAGVYYRLGNYAKAERHYIRALNIGRKTRGEQDVNTLKTTLELARFYGDVGNLASALQLFDRAILGFERTRGPEDPLTLDAVSGMARLYVKNRNYQVAEPLYLRLYKADERLLGPDAKETLASLHNLAEVYLALAQYEKAEPLLLRLLRAMERAAGRDGLQSLVVAHQLATVYFELKQYAKAEELDLRVSNAPGLNDRSLKAAVFAGLAGIYYQQKNWQKARIFLGRHLAETETGNGADDSLGGRTNRTILIRIISRLVLEGLEPAELGTAETFETAQRLFNSEAAQSIRRMAVRSLPRDGKLETVIREYQDLTTEVQRLADVQGRLWMTYDNMIIGNMRYDSKTGWEGPSTVLLERSKVIDTQADNAASIAAVKARIKEIDAVLAQQFPKYGELVRPQPISVADAQAQLRPNEALVLFLDTGPSEGVAPGETFVWVVTNTRIRWVRSDLDAAALTREVNALRCGLDRDAWSGPDCANLLGATYSAADAGADKLPPFAHDRAHRLYEALFGQVKDLIAGKHLFIVPSGALTQLPFHVLETAPLAGGDPRKAAWLVRSHAVTVLPSASSLKALRAVIRDSNAHKAMVGFGNPLLDGDQSEKGRDAAYNTALAQKARERQSCADVGPATAWQRMVGLFGSPGSRQLDTRNGHGVRGVRQLEVRRGLVNVAVVRQQTPLPETADELCAVGRSVNADMADIRLGASANERDIKALSERGELARYRMVYFATHGAMAGQVSQDAEPGLLLTPPAKASEEDDGYLSASEIAALKLDADWVILSACNTAAGQAKNAEALSGLARAFIYAGARSLLVSHWAVDSDAAVQLITSAVREISKEKGVGRAEALRRAMLALIDKGDARQAHPEYWAPFVVIGEGAR
jgi:CHAT domain-containing protein/tetratricopeptide (TPR) repeat protein